MFGPGPYPAHLSADSVDVLEAMEREEALLDAWLERDREREMESREWTTPSESEREAA